MPMYTRVSKEASILNARDIVIDLCLLKEKDLAPYLVT
jgi:hypothetical protein